MYDSLCVFSHFFSDSLSYVYLAMLMREDTQNEVVQPVVLALAAANGYYTSPMSNPYPISNDL